MNPLSPFTDYRRHKRSALLQIALICLATVGLFILVGVLDTILARANAASLPDRAAYRRPHALSGCPYCKGFFPHSRGG